MTAHPGGSHPGCCYPYEIRGWERGKKGGEERKRKREKKEKRRKKEKVIFFTMCAIRPFFENSKSGAFSRDLEFLTPWRLAASTSSREIAF